MFAFRAPTIVGLLCVIALLFLGCSQAPPSVAELPGLPVRVYAVDRLLTYPLDFGDYNGPRIVAPAPAKPAETEGLPGKTPSQTQYEDVTERLRRLIERVVCDAEPWASAGGKAVLEFYRPTGQMYVRQTLEGHRQLAALLGDLEKERQITITVEARFIEADAAASDALIKLLAADPSAEPAGPQPIIIGNTSSSGPGTCQVGFLDNSQTAAFLKEAEARSTRIVFLPQITVWNGQRAWVSQGTVHRLSLPRTDKPDRPRELVDFTAGCIFDAKATASADRRYVQLDMWPWYGQPDEANTIVNRIIDVGGHETLGRQVTHLMTSIIVPDGGTLAMPMPLGRSRLVGVVASGDTLLFGDKAPAGSLEPVWEPVDAKGEPQKYLWLLVKPTIIVEPEREELGAAEPSPAGNR